MPSRAVAAFVSAAVACGVVTLPCRAQDARPEAPLAIADCAALAPPGTVGLDALERVCPALGVQLEALGVRTALADGSAERLDATSLRPLALSVRPLRRAPPTLDALAGTLAEIDPATTPQSWWTRLKNWLQALLDANAGRRAETPGWLSDWLRRLTPGEALRSLLIGALALGTLVAAVVVVVREGRAAGLRWPTRRRAASTSAPDLLAAGAPGAPDLDALPEAERPGALFRYVASRLAGEGHLPPLSGRTHRELRRQARFERDDERRAWDALATLAERQLFAPEPAAPAQAEPVLATARRLWAPVP